RSTSSISYTLISKVSVVAVAPRRFEGAGGPSGPSTQQAPGLEEEEEEDVMPCLEERSSSCPHLSCSWEPLILLSGLELMLLLPVTLLVLVTMEEPEL
ncbi:hypothetical protein INR49_001453, partial [Caranx melampygus]